MSKIIFKPSLVDMGSMPCVKAIKFIHSCTNITLVNKPAWVYDVAINYEPNTSANKVFGSLSIEVSPDSAVPSASGYLEFNCDGETVLLPCIYSYDSEHIKVNDLIDSLFISNGDQSFIHNGDRPRAMLIALRWLQDNNGASSTNIRLVELPIDSLGLVNIPSDYVDYIGVHAFNEEGYLLPLMLNTSINISGSHLQDSDDLFVTDDNGYVISTTATPRVANEKSKYRYLGIDIDNIGTRNHYNIKRGTVSTNGMYRYDPVMRQFHITGVKNTFVVLEYISDPLIRYRLRMETGSLSVHKHYQATLQAYIYSELIANNRNVPANAKMMAENKYKRAYMLANRRKLKLNELIQIIRGIT
jgi:hypothetical protein